ncbi:hypothetical protein SAY87_001364 [Trapa incisa]|nr:hypothetical protein SAY87_001364 [Trapa incisa]
MESSILESIGVEIIGVMSPVSICMFLVVLLVYALSPANPFSTPSSPPIRTAANLVYLENPSDSTAQKLEGALLNALVFVVIIAVVTFVLVALYYFKFTNFLKNYTRFSAFFVLATMGGSIFLSIIQHFSIPVDAITCFLLLFNFTVVGVLSVFSGGIPIILRQFYMVSLGIIVAAWFTKLPEWTTWIVLVALAVYDLVAVLAPGGPLKLLVELASSRDEELPALVYEARPVAPPQNGGSHRTNMGLLAAGFSQPGSVEMQSVSGNSGWRNDVDGSRDTLGNDEGGSSRDGREEISPLVSNARQRRSSSSDSPEYSAVNVSTPNRVGHFGDRDSQIEETSPLVEAVHAGNQREQAAMEDDDADDNLGLNRGIRLGLGDFIFYSVLVGRAAMYDLMTVYACYLAIVSGLGCTLILLSVCRRALPALPISIALGVMFYFLTRLLMEPFVVGISTNLLMF